MSYFLGHFLVKFTSHYCFRISINSINSVNSVNSIHSVNFVNSEQAVYSAVLPPSLMVCLLFTRTQIALGKRMYFSEDFFYLFRGEDINRVGKKVWLLEKAAINHPLAAICFIIGISPMVQKILFNF